MKNRKYKRLIQGTFRIILYYLWLLKINGNNFKFLGAAPTWGPQMAAPLLWASTSQCCPTRPVSVERHGVS